MNEDIPETQSPEAPQKPQSKNLGAPAKVAMGLVGLGTVLGVGGAVPAESQAPQRPPAAVAAPFPDNSPDKVESGTNIPGTETFVGLEHDHNGTVNQGEDSSGQALFKELFPNFVAGSSNPQGGTVGDGWLLKDVETTRTELQPVPVLLPGKSVETTIETVDATKYPIKSRWEEDFHTSPELAQQLRTAAEDCYAQIEAQQNQGYLLTGVQVGGLSSDEDNATRPGDPMAGLGEQSELNHHLANERGMAGVATMAEVLHEHGVDPAMLSLLDGQEIQASPKEIDQILQYSKMLGQDPLETIQDYNRARSFGLQPLMDELFVNNRGIVCIASFTKLETQMLPGAPQVKMMMVPVEVNGQKRIWRIEIPGEILLIPLLYMAIRLAPGSLGGGAPIRPTQPPAGAGPDPLGRVPIPLPKPKKPKYVPPGPPPPPPAPVEWKPGSKPPKEVGKGQDGYWQRPERIKQPNVNTNFHDSGRAGHRSNARHEHQGKKRGSSKGNGGGRRNGSR